MHVTVATEDIHCHKNLSEEPQAMFVWQLPEVLLFEGAYVTRLHDAHTFDARKAVLP